MGCIQKGIEGWQSGLNDENIIFSNTGQGNKFVIVDFQVPRLPNLVKCNSKRKIENAFSELSTLERKDEISNTNPVHIGNNPIPQFQGML